MALIWGKSEDFGVVLPRSAGARVEVSEGQVVGKGHRDWCREKKEGLFLSLLER